MIQLAIPIAMLICTYTTSTYSIIWLPATNTQKKGPAKANNTLHLLFPTHAFRESDSAASEPEPSPESILTVGMKLSAASSAIPTSFGGKHFVL